MSVLSVTSPVQVQLDSIDEEESLGKVINNPGTVTIKSLPPEVLSTIFKYIGRGEEGCSTQDDSNQTFPSTDWLVLNMVCKRWRDIVCNDPTFWRSINVGRSPKWLLLCLTRSRSIPIDVRLCEPSTLSSVAVLLHRHANRVRTLLVTRTATRALRDLSSLFSLRLPALQVLSIDAEDSRYAHMRLDDHLRIDKTKMPSLHTLTLKYIKLSWYSPVLSQLRVLELIAAGPTPLSPDWLTLNEFLAALEACHSLEELIMFDSLPICLCGQDAPTDRVIALPKLRTAQLVVLRSYGRYTDLYHLFSHVRFPASAQICAVDLSSQHGQLSRYVPNDTSCLPILSIATHARFYGLGGFSAWCETQAPGQLAEGSPDLFQTITPRGNGRSREKQESQQGELEVYLVHWENGGDDQNAAQSDWDASGPSAGAFLHAFNASALSRLQTLVFNCAPHSSATARNREEDIRSFLFALGAAGAGAGGRGEPHSDEPQPDVEAAVDATTALTARHGHNGNENANVTDVPLKMLRSLCIHAATWYDRLPRDLERCLRARHAGGAAKMADLDVQVASVSASASQGQGEEERYSRATTLTEGRRAELHLLLDLFLERPGRYNEVHE
ncbi:hypothetical protein C8Q74DRAFT_1284725 [Fomes fomentarius]|nr:hypothetical protein C8Q74DRAFT_1284725 [Fomes fomentarius]